MCSCWHRVSSASTWSWLGSLVWMFVCGVWTQWTLDVMKLVTATAWRVATSLPYCHCDRQTSSQTASGLISRAPASQSVSLPCCERAGEGQLLGQKELTQASFSFSCLWPWPFPCFPAAFWEGTDLEALLSPDQVSDSLQPPDAHRSPFIFSKVDWVGATDNEEFIFSSQDFQIVASGPRSGTFLQPWQALTSELTVSVWPCSQLCQQVPSLWII